MITVEQLSKIGGRAANENMQSILSGLSVYGTRAGINVPHRLAHYVAQLCHESQEFKYDQEIASGAAYEGRKDLGNTQPGDGKRFKGRTPGQITGRANYTAFRDWCRAKGLNPPDFVEHPELLNTDPWEGLGFIWFWTTRKLNQYADTNDIEMITRRVNGGLNGYDDRLADYTRVALVLLGFEPNDVVGFQAKAQHEGFLPADTKDAKQVDGVPGPKTRAALHLMLVEMGKQESPVTADIETKAAPVVEPKPVVPEGADKPGILRGLGGFSLVGLTTFFTGIPDPLKYVIAACVILLIIAMIWRGEQIAMRARKVLKELF